MATRYKSGFDLVRIGPAHYRRVDGKLQIRHGGARITVALSGGTVGGVTRLLPQDYRRPVRHSPAKLATRRNWRSMRSRFLEENGGRLRRPIAVVETLAIRASHTRFNEATESSVQRRVLTTADGRVSVWSKHHVRYAGTTENPHCRR